MEEQLMTKPALEGTGGYHNASNTHSLTFTKKHHIKSFKFPDG